MSRNFFSHPVITDSRYQRTLNRRPECVSNNRVDRASVFTQWNLEITKGQETEKIYSLWGFVVSRFFSVNSSITGEKNDVRCSAVFERGSLILAYRGSIVLENFFSGQTCLNFIIISNFAPTCSVQQHDTAMTYLYEVSMKIQQFLSGLLSSDQSAGWSFIFSVTCLRQIMYYYLQELNSFCKLSPSLVTDQTFGILLLA